MVLRFLLYVPKNIGDECSRLVYVPGAAQTRVDSTLVSVLFAAHEPPAMNREGQDKQESLQIAVVCGWYPGRKYENTAQYGDNDRFHLLHVLYVASVVGCCS